MTLLKRLGNKSAIAEKIIPLFPRHDSYSIFRVPFFGAGGIFFRKRRSRHNYLNDLDQEVINLYRVVNDSPELFEKQLWETPIHSSLWAWWQNNIPKDPIKRAVRFLILSNCGVMGKAENLKYVNSGAVQMALKELRKFNLDRCKFDCDTALKFLKKTSWTLDQDGKVFTYCDPPYIGTTSNYSDKSWSAADLKEMVEYLLSEGERFAISELGGGLSDEILSSFPLQKVPVCTKYFLTQKKAEECLWVNYSPPQEQIDIFGNRVE